LRDSLLIDMLLSVLSFLVVAQSSSEVPEGLMNNSVYLHAFYKTVSVGDVSFTSKHDRYFPTQTTNSVH